MFVGLKMTASHWVHLNTYLSLGVIVAMLAAAIVFSRRKERRLVAAGGRAATAGGVMAAPAGEVGAHEALEPVEALDAGDEPEID